jgi:hypothetical protein
MKAPRRLWRRYLRNNPRVIYLAACERLGILRFDAADLLASAAEVRGREGGAGSGVAAGGPPPEGDSRAPLFR